MLPSRLSAPIVVLVILLSDPRIALVPVMDCGEPLAEVRSIPELGLDLREQDPDGAFGRVRTGVLQRLQAATEHLPHRARLLIVEGHRTSSEQARRFALQVDRLRASGITDPIELRRQASAFVSPVEVAPHCAGAAVDLTLTDTNGDELDMGGPVNGHRTGDEQTCPMDAPELHTQARNNRGLLKSAMTASGFVNYPTEWWHWSYGDRYWAFITKAGAARYGAI